jgi:hypothetical protein
MNVGTPACGMNAAVRSFVRVTLSRGYNVLGIRFGFEGLVLDKVSKSIVIESITKLIIIKHRTIFYWDAERKYCLDIKRYSFIVTNIRRVKI